MREGRGLMNMSNNEIREPEMAQRMNVEPVEIPGRRDSDQAYKTVLEVNRLQTAKAAFTTSRIPLSKAAYLVSGPIQPRAGDIVFARVKELRRQKKLELPSGRLAKIFPGDEIIICYGNRYAPDQYEAFVPDDLGPCQLVAAGGIAARLTSKHAMIADPTEIEPLGILAEANGRRLNLLDWALPMHPLPANRPPTVAVIGTSMNAGKTTSVSNLIRGLAQSGCRVGAAKITGTGSGPDRWSMIDSGAKYMVDFTDAGFASTFCCSTGEIEGILCTLIDYLTEKQCHAIVIEVADGVMQEETAALVRSSCFRDAVDGLLFAAGDAMGAVAGVQWLHQHKWPVLGVTGLFTASPLAVREARQALEAPIFNADELATPEIAGNLIGLNGLFSESSHPEVGIA